MLALRLVEKEKEGFVWPTHLRAPRLASSVTEASSSRTTTSTPIIIEPYWASRDASMA